MVNLLSGLDYFLFDPFITCLSPRNSFLLEKTRCKVLKRQMVVNKSSS
uniref:Uncharacterized protein n=1 Tax=Rhizophora mucronata TaxID=61149 RepID=A0A2P2Q740_RHIMU